MCTAPDEGAVQDTANAGSEDYWSGKSALDTEVLFSQQFQLQQRIEDLCQEMIGLFGGQQRYLKNMTTNVRRIATQPVLRPVVRSPQRGILGQIHMGGLQGQQPGLVV